MPKCFGMWSVGPEDEIPSGSPRDYDRRNTRIESAHGDIIAQLRATLDNPNASTEARRSAAEALDSLAYEVSPVPQKTGRRLVEGELVDVYKDDSDVSSGGRLAASIGASIQEDIASVIAKLR